VVGELKEMESKKAGKSKKVDWTEVGFWSGIATLPMMFATGLITGVFGAGVVPLGTWLVMALAAFWKLEEHVRKTCRAIYDSISLDTKIRLAHKASSTFADVAVIFGFGLAAVPLINEFYQIRISTHPNGDSIFYIVALLIYWFFYYGGLLVTDARLSEAIRRY
jgi:hypothetical protein